MKKWMIALLFFCTAAAGCTGGLFSASAPEAVPTRRLPTETRIPTRTPRPTASLTPVPSATWTPTLSPSPTITPTPTSPAMSIPGLRAGSYPGSDIQIEEELDRGFNYRRYYASYLSEGLRIYALLTIPTAEMPEGGFPAIVFNHGYIPPKEYRTTERYLAYVDALARAGYVVFRIDYRGHDRSEGAAAGAYGSPGYTIDVLNAFESIKKLPQVNPAKIGMWGHSMGGFLTLRAMVILPDIRAGVIWAGVVGDYFDLINNWHTGAATPTPGPGGSRRFRGWLEAYGSPEDNPDFWNSLSANFYLDDLSGPLQLHHGTADSEVPLAFSEKLAKEVLSTGKTVEFYQYAGNDHNISQSFTLAMNRTITFFDRYLK